MNNNQQSFKNNKSTLYIVSTPIGNLKDITYRAIDTLSSVDFIFAEDTRNSKKLLNHYNIDKKLFSYHDYSNESVDNEIIRLLSENKTIALISDAGTPGINDPGYEIIKRVISEGYNVVPVPGASAILASIVVSGLIIQPFTFLGFLPRKKQEIIEYISDFKYRKETLVIYESPLRIKNLLSIFYETLGNRRITLSRELTKIYETITRTTLSDIQNEEINDKGEYVLIVEGYFNNLEIDISIEEHMTLYLKQGYTEKEAMKKIADDRKISKKEIYKHLKINN